MSHDYLSSGKPKGGYDYFSSGKPKGGFDYLNDPYKNTNHGNIKITLEEYSHAKQRTSTRKLS